MAHYKPSKRPDYDAVYNLHLKIAQDRRLIEWYQTGSFANIQYDTVPCEALVKVVKFHQENSKTEKLFDTRSAKVTDGTRSSSSLGSEENPVQQRMEEARGTLVLTSELTENQINLWKTKNTKKAFTNSVP